MIGEDGIIGQAKEASLKYQNSALQEQLLLNSIEGQIASSSNGSNNNNSNNGNGTDKGNSSDAGNSNGNGEDNLDKIDELNKEIEELKRQIDLLKDYQTAGDAREKDVLAGKTFSCSAGIGLTGTMPNNGLLT